MPLSPKQAAFVAEYLIDLNATQAAIRAGYSAKTAEQIGHQLLKKTSVAEAVAAGQSRLAAKLEVTAEAVVAELAKIGFMQIEADGEGRAPLLSVKRAALVDLGKHLGLFKERMPGDSPDNPVHTEVRAPDPVAVADIVARYTAKPATKH